MSRRMRIEDLLALSVPSQPTVSPDGSAIAYVLSGNDAAADTSVSALWIADGSGSTRALTHGTTDASPAFSPDGTAIAFQRAGQLWTLPVAGGEPKQLTTLPLGAGAPVWSPGGTRIAFTAPVDFAAADNEGDADRARRSAAPIVSDGVGYQADGAGFLRTLRSQLHVIDVESGEVRQLTDGEEHVGSPAWSPDGATLAFTAHPDGVDELTMRSSVYFIDAVDPKALPRAVAFEDGFAGTVTFTPDGNGLVVVGWAGDPRAHAGLFAVDLATGDVTELAASLDRNVMPGAPAYPGALPQFTAEGDVLFAIRDRGCTHLYVVPFTGGEPRLVHGGDGHVVSGLSVAGSNAAIALATPTSFGEIVAVDLGTGAENVVTSHGDTLAEIDLFVRESREFTISDGVSVQGWIIRDPEVTGRTPLLIDVHGGPHNAWNGAADEMHLYHQELAARGWTVLIVNPRGSDGYGTEFYDAVFGAWGEADKNDFLEPIDQLVAEGLADPKRLAITGYSYGGFTTCYLTSRDDRFAAAVTGGVVADLVSMGGTSDDAHFLSVAELGALPWKGGDRERLAELSPYTHVDKVTTPTLVLHGGDDVRCPVGQAEQWHYALREQGVPTCLVIYPGESHVFPLLGKPSHRMDFCTRIVGWVEQYAGDAEGPRPEPIDAAHWQRRLTALAKRHKVPGAQLGIMRLGKGNADEIVTAATGTLNRDISTGAPVTTDSVFQIGSISKVWTASVVMRLVDEGKIALDTKIADILPGFRLINDDLTDGVTVWHLLTHTSGIDGDVFTDTGRGDDCIEKYAYQLVDAGQNHPIGATWSYCNSGYSLLGAVIEQITGQTWDAAMRDLLFSPLGLTHTVTLPEDAIRYAAAVGHVDVGDEQIVTPTWGLPRSLGPAGLITARAEDVLAFARLHMTGGVAADGTRLLTEESVLAMQQLHADVPDKYSLGDSWGLGWIRFGWNGTRLYGHDGNTIGQAAFLRIHAESGVAVTLLTNGGHTRDLYEDLYREIFAELSGITMQSSLQPPVEPVDVDVTPFVGTYERAGIKMEILTNDEGPLLRTTMTGPLVEMTPESAVDEYPLVPVSDKLFAVRAPGTETWIAVTFYSLPTGEEYLHFGARATPKTAVPA